MALSVTGEQVELVLRRLLPQRGYELLNKPRTKGETGADMIAKKNNEDVFIECIGYQENPSLRSKQFYEGFFRTVSRLKDGASRCVLALPTGFNKGKKQRAKQYGEAWTRIGNTFPELEIWPVNVKENTYYECKWNNWPADSFGSEISHSRIKKASEIYRYTEEFHLENCTEEIKSIYIKLKGQFLETKSSIDFMPTKTYIGVVDRKRIAYIQLKGKNVHLIILMNENETKDILKSQHHEIVAFTESQQKRWGGKNPTCAINLRDVEYWKEIQQLIEQLVKRYE